jgi:hypothetical protein
MTVGRQGGKTAKSITRLGVYTLVLAAGTVGIVLGQRGGFVNGEAALYAPPNPHYDGRFTYARIRFTQTCCVYNGQYRDVKWGHDYPRSDFHFPKLLRELTTMQVRDDSTAIVTFDDPTLFRYPWAYMAEPGYWMPSDKEVEGMRNYLLKGGFLVIDDFVGNHWYNFEEQMRRVFPLLHPIPLAKDHPIFDSFYRIESQEWPHPNYPGITGKFFAFFEDNDPTRRMMAIVNYDYDVSEYWEYSDEGFFPVDLTNTAYKLGINYMIYSMSR